MQGRGERIYLLDALRGAAILLMVVHHGAMDWNQWFGGLDVILQSRWLFWVRLGFVCLFILLSGAATQFTRSNARRGVRMLLVAMAMTLVTFWIDPDYYIVFGIIHFMGCAALIYALVGDLPVHPVIWGALFAVTYPILLGRDYPIRHLWMLGITDPSFASSDYFPIFPWIFMYYIGVSLGKRLRDGRVPEGVYRLRCRPLETVGRHTLAIYVLHQPLFFGLYGLWRMLARS